MSMPKGFWYLNTQRAKGSDGNPNASKALDAQCERWLKDMGYTQRTDITFSVEDQSTLHSLGIRP